MLGRRRTVVERRESMIERDLRARGIRDVAVLAAMRDVPRERFVPDVLKSSAYEDRALPIEEGQTISQPFMVSLMAEAAALTPECRVLEVGTGSGYGAAILAKLAAEVWTVERRGRLAQSARERLDGLGFRNVRVVHGDGSHGLASMAPFDAIVVTAAAESVPTSLRDQLVDGGRLVIPVGPTDGDQRLLRIVRDGAESVEEDLGLVRFVPLISSDCG